MPDQEDIATWVTRPLTTGELVFLEDIRPNDPDDRCAICQTQYGTSDEDRPPEHAVRFPCGHDVGNACLHTWLDGVWRNPRCMFCNESVIPARFLWEQVEKIWSTLVTMSPEAWESGTVGGPLSRASTPLSRYTDEVGYLTHLETPNKTLAPSCVWLLVAANSFGLALMQYVDLLNASTNSQDNGLKRLENAKWAFEDSYYSYQRVSEGMVVEWANKWDIKDPLCVKSLRSKPRRVTTDIFFLLLWTSVILGLLCMEIEIIKKVLSSHRPTGYLVSGNWVECGSCTNIVLCCFFLDALPPGDSLRGNSGRGIFSREASTNISAW